MSESSSMPSQTSGSRSGNEDDHSPTHPDLTAELDLGFEGADDILGGETVSEVVRKALERYVRR